MPSEPAMNSFKCDSFGNPTYAAGPAQRVAPNVSFPSGWQSGESYSIARTASGNSPETVTQTGSTNAGNIQVGYILTGVRIWKGAGIGYAPRDPSYKPTWVIAPRNFGVDVWPQGTIVRTWTLKKLNVSSVPKGSMLPTGAWTTKVFHAKSDGQGGITWDPPN